MVWGYLGLHEVSIAPHRGGGGEQPATQQQPARHHQLHPHQPATRAPPAQGCSIWHVVDDVDIVISFAGSVHESRRIKQELEDMVSSLDMTMPLPVLSTEELSHRGRLAGTRQTAQTTLRAQQWWNRVVTVWVKIAGLANLNVGSCTWLVLMNVAHNTCGPVRPSVVNQGHTGVTEWAIN